MKSILDPSFRYSNSSETDLKKTFNRIRREQAEQAKRKVADEAEAAAKVTNLKGRK